jgi:AcrR family transcriptional regulator
MSRPVEPRRAYHSPRRREQARGTRAAILQAGRELFVGGGYVATTIDAIATRANVSVETVYATFGTKRAILSDLLDVSMAGDNAPVPILDRGWVGALRAEPDPKRRLRILARNGRAILERTAAVYQVLAGAAAADPQLASLLELNKAQRYAGQRELLRLALADHPLREGMTVRSAADIVFAVGSPETYRLLVVDRGWSAPRFERWYAQTLTDLLLDPNAD